MDKDILTFFMIMFLIFSIPFLYVVDVNNETIAKNKALKICREKGYETYIVFSRKVLGKKPYELICGTLEERMIYEKKIKVYKTNNQTMIIVGENENNPYQR